MSYIYKGRVTAYDNIANGSATGREKTITGVSEVSPALSDELLRTVSGGVTSWHTSGPAENRFVGQTSYATSLGRPNQERLGTS